MAPSVVFLVFAVGMGVVFIWDVGGAATAIFVIATENRR
jgi:hypothetical protein